MRTRTNFNFDIKSDLKKTTGNSHYNGFGHWA